MRQKLNKQLDFSNNIYTFEFKKEKNNYDLIVD